MTFENVWKSLKEKCIREKCKKDNLKQVYEIKKEMQKLEMEFNKNMQELQDKMNKTAVYALHGSIYCHFLEEAHGQDLQ